MPVPGVARRRFAPILDMLDGHADIAAARRELDGIGQEVPDHLL